MMFHTKEMLLKKKEITKITEDIIPCNSLTNFVMIMIEYFFLTLILIPIQN